MPQFAAAANRCNVMADAVTPTMTRMNRRQSYISTNNMEGGCIYRRLAEPAHEGPLSDEHIIAQSIGGMLIACSPTAPRSARTCQACPWRCLCPAGREGHNRVFVSPVLPRRGRGPLFTGTAISPSFAARGADEPAKVFHLGLICTNPPGGRVFERSCSTCAHSGTRRVASCISIMCSWTPQISTALSQWQQSSQVAGLMPSGPTSMIRPSRRLPRSIDSRTRRMRLGQNANKQLDATQKGRKPASFDSSHPRAGSSNPVPSRREMLWGGRRGWQFRRLNQSMECRDAPAERFEQVPGCPGPRWHDHCRRRDEPVELADWRCASPH
jgi:hypothetical protein